MKNISVLSHAPYSIPYGATTSLRNHYYIFESKSQYQFTHIERNQRIFGGVEKLELDPGCYQNIREKYIAPLPIYNNNNHNSLQSALAQAKYLTRLKFDKINLDKTLYLLSKINPDIVHINSLVLLPAVYKIKNDAGLNQLPIVAHVRELLKPNVNSFYKNTMNEISHFICIDYSTCDRLLKVAPYLSRNKVSVVQNPFSSSDVEPDPIFYEDIPRNFKVYTIVGQVLPVKGVEFVCKAFLAANLSNAVLVVVGSSPNDKPTSYSEAVRKICEAHPNQLRWLGKQLNLTSRGFFNCIDVLIRGEGEFCTGRTTYESLFSGSSVIMPGSYEYLSRDFDLNAFSKRIVFYRPNSFDDLISAFHLTHLNISKHNSRMNSSERFKLSNYDTYLEKVSRIYELVMENR